MSIHGSRHLAVKPKRTSAARKLASALAICAAGCAPAAPTTTGGPDPTQVDPNHWSGGTVRSLDGAGAGEMSKSSKYKMVFTLGRPTVEQQKNNSSGYQLQSVIAETKASEK